MAAENDMNVFTSDIERLPDLAKNFLWQAVIIPEEGTPLASIFNLNDGTKQLCLRCRASGLPQRTINDELVTHWQGSKKVYPGRMTMDGTVTLKFDEFQDWKVSHIFHAWMNLIHNCNIGHDGGDTGIYFDTKTGAAVSNYMKDYSAKIKLTCFDSRLSDSMSHDYTLYYCWPKNMHGVPLDQETSSKIQREIEFRYSTFQETKREEELEA